MIVLMSKHNTSHGRVTPRVQVLPIDFGVPLEKGVVGESCTEAFPPERPGVNQIPLNTDARAGVRDTLISCYDWLAGKLTDIERGQNKWYGMFLWVEFFEFRLFPRGFNHHDRSLTLIRSVVAVKIGDLTTYHTYVLLEDKQ